MIIAVDFDGTVVTHNFPRVGVDVGAVPVLKKFVDEGHQIILNTMRSHKEVMFTIPEIGIYQNIDTLQDAEDWFKKNNIPLYGVNEKPDQKTWTDSPKVLADMYIDDRNFGCPLRNDENGMGSYVDWRAVAEGFGYDYDELCKS